MTEPTHIRPATPGDAEVVTSFNLAMALETERKRLDERTVRAGVERAIGDGKHARYFIACAGERVVGQLMVTFEWSDWRNADFWWIQSVYVHPEFRSRGIFGALYRHVEGLAREAGACGMRLYVEVENGSAQEVYRRLGMKNAGYYVFEADWSGEGKTRMEDGR